MKQYPLFTILTCLFFIHSSIFAQLNISIKGKISLNKMDNMITISAKTENNESFFIEDLSFNLLALKKSNTNSYSSNRQSGKFSLMGLEEKNISEIKMNLNEDEELRVYLFIKKSEKLISKDSVVLMPKIEKLNSNSSIEEKDFMLKGIVIEEVITIIGKDFHDLFYQAYSSSGSSYPFIITLKEKPYYGRSSILTIEADNSKIYEFMTKPNEDFLKASVRTTLQKLSQYSKQRELLYNNRRI